MPSTSSLMEYGEEYIEACFFAWYRAGAPGLTTKNGNPSANGFHFMKVIPPSSDGRKPNIKTVSRWMETHGWRERADALDAQVSIQLESEVIQERIKTLKKLSKYGESLAEKGLQFINKDDPFVDNASAAVRAIIAGSEMQFKYAGQAAVLEKIAQMSDPQLEKEILRLLGKESEETSDNENENIEATLEDIPEDDDTAKDIDS